MQIFFHKLRPLGQPHVLPILHFHHTRRYIISSERGGEAVPGNRGPLWVGSTVMGPPNPSGSLQLVCRILNLEYFCHLKKTELLLHSVDPLICLERFQSLLEDWWLGIHEVLEQAILVDFTAALVILTTGVVSYVTQSFLHVALHLFHVALAPQKLREKHVRSVRRRRWW